MTHSTFVQLADVGQPSNVCLARDISYYDISVRFGRLRWINEKPGALAGLDRKYELEQI
ncbi:MULTISPECIES: hypothetical protein [Bradyrhizobium]|uniref:hypothetical protein n=1 Tax=Bradyrhizobium TaxID=374 RepID=UPI000A83FDAC|nr:MULTISPECIES: hypothetical protein [Bradyrhizobium]